MGLIRNAVEQGRQVGEAIFQSPRRGRKQAFDALVVGAGPAGISATLALRDRGLEVLLVEQGEFGGTIRHYPRAKIVMTGALDLPGFGTVKRRTMSKEQLIALWDDIQTKTAMPVETGVRVEQLALDGDTWVVRAANGWERRAANVVLALGRRGSPRRLGVPGEELEKVCYRLIEPDPFRHKHVLIVGGGNAAAECAIALADDAQCKSVWLSYRRAEFARLRAQVRDRLSQLVAEGKVRTLMSSEVVSIEPGHVSLKSAQGDLRLDNDAVIVQIGGTAPDAVLASFGIRTVTKRGEA
jgi:thioredoxin reductase